LTGNYQTGFQGEVFVFKELRRNNQFVKAVWPNKSYFETSDVIHNFENEKIYIIKSGISYSILAETVNGSKIYVEVKSTKGSSGKLPIYSSQNQWSFLHQVNKKDIYCLARVINTNANHKRVYSFVLTSKLEIKRITNFF
jgi:hypothetical protein